MEATAKPSRTSDRRLPMPAPRFGWKDYQSLLLGAVASLAAITLHSYPVYRPQLYDDDFAIAADSWTWQQARDNLWQPWNEHAMPLGRLSTWALVQAAGRPTDLPLVLALQGPCALVVTMWLVYLFVRREMGHRFYGLTAMILFGVTLKYNEAVVWFAASFAVLALATMLLALLSAQRWRQTGRWYHLALCAFWTALAPGWFATGILAGPFCCLYLWASWKRRDALPAPGEAAEIQDHSSFRYLAASLAPMVGSLVFLGISLPHNLQRIQHAGHYAGKTASQVCDPLAGLELTGRTVVDNLVFGVNAFGSTLPRALVPLLVGLLALAGWWWWRQQASRRPMMLLGLGLLLFSYWLIYSFRAGWPYENFMSRWTRYNVLPYLGLVLFLCGGLPSRQGTLFQLALSGFLSRGQAGALILLTGLLLVLQLPLEIMGRRALERERIPQIEVMRHIEEVDAVCRARHISAATARQALGPLEVPSCPINGWVFLRGSDSPVEMSVDQARLLLDP